MYQLLEHAAYTHLMIAEGKGTIGIEVPNKSAKIVSMKSLISSKRFQDAW